MNLLEAGYELAALNFLAGGATTVNSMDMRPRRGADVFGEAGLRAFFGSPLSDLFWDIPVADQFARARAFARDYHDTYDGRIRAAVCPHDDWTCTADLWERAAEFAAANPDLLVHTHLLEFEASNTMARANGAVDSLDLLADVGLLDDRLIAAHFRVADADDVRRVAAANASVAHCPSDRSVSKRAETRSCQTGRPFTAPVGRGNAVRIVGRSTARFSYITMEFMVADAAVTQPVSA